MKTAEIKYCSLDIETSGFDPLKNEVLEVGFAFFTFDEKGIQITKEFTQVFNPSHPVPANILGLTGISQKELDEAPKFSEFKSFLQKELGDAIIVGHNISFDTKFLESVGIKFSGKSIDTLDLVQFILPTHHSYNLENLMHTFGISHKEAHRALADSKATIKLLEKLLQVFNSFPSGLKKQIVNLVKGREIIWEDLLEIKLPALPISSQPETKKQEKEKFDGNQKISLDSNIIYNFQLGQQYIKEIAIAAKKSKTKILMVVPKSQQATELFLKGWAQDIGLLSENIFSEKKFEAFLNKKNILPEEVRFGLKILVWKETNWQHKTVQDLNLSFFGGQFKILLREKKLRKTKTQRL